MFTGIITDIGTVRAISRNTGGQSKNDWGGDTRMEVDCAYDVSTIDIGASISHAGACMTVVEKEASPAGGGWYAFEVSDESLSKTTMGTWAAGDGGHLVTGHVDGVGELTGREEIAGSLKLDFAAPDHIAYGIAPKGSITVDGVSLTVNEVSGSSFSVNIIPHTASATTLGGLKLGDKVNLEMDLIARYVARYLSAQTNLPMGKCETET